MYVHGSQIFAEIHTENLGLAGRGSLRVRREGRIGISRITGGAILRRRRQRLLHGGGVALLGHTIASRRRRRRRARQTTHFPFNLSL